MATIQKRDRSYRVRIRRKGFPVLTASFDSRVQAEAWARQRESEMDRGVVHFATVEAERTTVADLIDRYLAEVTVTHKGEESEAYRLRALTRGPLGNRYVAGVRAQDIAHWRKMRLYEVGPSSVTREMNLLHRVFELARLEWGIGDNNPVTNVDRPPAPPGRDRRLNDDEESRLLAACRKSRNSWLEPVAICAIETAMRRSELLGLRWTDLNLSTGTARLRNTKNREARTIPLSARAVATLAILPRDINGRVFPTTGNAVKLAWRRTVNSAKISDLHLHDLRHEATSRLVEIGTLNMLEVAAITGHKDLQMLKRYFHPRAEELRKKLGWA